MNTSDTPTPKPAPPKRPQVDQVFDGKTAAPSEKPKFVRKPHLTERPLKNHDGLLALRKKMGGFTPSQSRSKKEKK